MLFSCMAIAASGCAPRQPFYFFEDGDLSHYVGAVQKIEYPDTCQDHLILLNFSDQSCVIEEQIQF
ncbi:MAG: hypothetical protein CMJ56_04600 [Planctomycetaceae bacterium]|nr:hypothetical protein [Planctomycetaceae bacterium]